MPTETITLDPTTEDAANAELVLNAAGGYGIRAHKYPVPDDEQQWAGSSDTEGDFLALERPKNREIPLTLSITGATDAAFRTAQRNLDRKIGKLKREKGTYKRTLPNGDTIVFDVETVNGGDRLFDDHFINQRYTEDTLVFVCKPYGRGPSSTFAAVSESTLPVLRATYAGVKGDVPALGKLLIDELAAKDQWWIKWGLRSRYYSSSADAALFYEAESRTPLGGAATAVGPTGASGAGSNVVTQGTLTPGWQAMLSTQAASAGNHLAHIGTFEVIARVQMPTANTGQVSIRLDWAEGDFRRFTSNSQVDFAADHSREGQWVLVSLGTVTLRKVAQGTQRWEGRIVAKSTVAGDDLIVDYLALFPITEGTGEAKGRVALEAPSSYSVRDEFDQAAGVLAAKTLPIGGTWAGAGSANDFSVEATGHTAVRAANGDASALNGGRFAIAGTTSLAAVVAQADIKVDNYATVFGFQTGLLLRYVDTSNFAKAYIRQPRSNFESFEVVFEVVVGGASVMLVSKAVPARGGVLRWDQLRATISASGRFAVYWGPVGAMSLVLSGDSTVLGTAGTLATGKVGLYDAKTDSAPVNRNFDNFYAAPAVADGALLASQSLELRHDRVIRKDSSGTLWPQVSDYAGDYLLIPPAGAEGRTTELIVDACQNDPDVGSDPALSQLRATLTVTPRYRAVPEP